MRELSPSAWWIASALAVGVPVGGTGCSGCDKRTDPATGPAPSAAASASSASAHVVKESLPRCRVEGSPLAIPGEDVVVGDAVVVSDALLVGVVRREGGRRVASVVRTPLDLASAHVVDVGPAFGEDPPPSPRIGAGASFVVSFARAAAKGDAGASAPGAPGATRLLEITRLEDGGSLGKKEGSVLQQADESLAFDVAWPESNAANGANAPIVAWDEDAPPPSAAGPVDRGIVKVKLLGDDTKPRVASPETSDAESPRLLAKAGGYWLAWLARRPEPAEGSAPNLDDAASPAEGPGERRAFRWVEIVALDAKGEATSPVRRVTPATGRVASFELARVAADGVELVVLVQDEAAHADGAGDRIVRFAVAGDKASGGDLIDGGVGHALADLLSLSGEASASAPRWLAWTDTQERAHLVPLGPALLAAGAATLEPSLDGARVLAAASPDRVFAVTGSAGAGRVELRRLACR